MLKVKVTSENALEMGKAAEHLVCADLILSGYRAFLSDQGLPYDLVLDLDGHLIRVQVKSSGRRKNVNALSKGRPRHAYVFHARRRGKNGAKRLTNADCDILAFVALDIGVVAYIPVFEVSQTCVLNPPGRVPNLKKPSEAKFIDEFPAHVAIQKVLKNAHRHKQST